MRRVIILLYLLSKARCEMKKVYMHMSQNSGYSQPIHKGYVYSQRNNEPAQIMTIDNTETRKANFEIPKMDIRKEICNFETDLINKMCMQRKEHKTDAVTSQVKENNESNVQNAEANTGQDLGTSEMRNMYNADIGFQVDAEDLRTDNRNLYDDWPYLYHTYEYEPHYGTYKRNTLNPSEKVIPVYEQVDDYGLTTPYTPHSQTYPKASISKIGLGSESVTNNPMMGHQPLFSYGLNDYTDKSGDEDYLTFKGLSNYHHIEPYLGKQNQHLDSIGVNDPISQMSSAPIYLTNDKKHTYDNNHQFQNHQKGSEVKNNEDAKSNYDAAKYNGYKNFLDTFTNKFGAEDHNKDSKYMLKLNSDKGEKKKGFRRVYHKDEYQEDNEFFDNTNNKTATEQNGTSKIRNGGSEAFLRSQAAAALGEERDSLSKNKDYASHGFDKRNEGINRNTGNMNNYNRYLNKNKHTALNNHGDYINSYGK